MITLPGLIDVHVHLRDMGQEHKEDFFSGTSAALAGGFTTVLDMPNNQLPITDYELLTKKQETAKLKIVSDVGFHFGSLGDNLDEFEKIKDKVWGLKLYLNQTTGGYIIDEDRLKKIYRKWHEVTEGKRPVLLHAEEDVMGIVTKVLQDTKHPTHICHISSIDEFTPIMKAKEKGLPITCGVCPHHLFLTVDDVEKLGSFGMMKPSLKTKKDQEFFWKHLEYIDLIESDHAPHAVEEKKSSNPPFGVPGLETTLPLLLTAVYEKRLKLQDIIDKCYENPRKIFHLPKQENTHIEISNIKYQISNSALHTKCGWSPFDGWEVRGKVMKVVLRGETFFENDKVLAQPGS
ncbi:MAG: amidohydrolase family protein [Patescibacteria group bacterium]